MSIVNIQALKQNGCQLWWPGAVASSNSPKAITANGDVKQLLPFPGAGIGMFDGTGDYLSIPAHGDFNLSNNVWSIEGRFYIAGAFATAYQDIITLNGLSSGYGAINLFIDTSGKIASAFSSNGTGWVNTGFFNWTTTLSQNTWYHYAVVRTSDGYIKGYLNGDLDYTYNIGSTTLCNTDHITIGKITYTPPYYLNGYLSELRISNTARYTANFTPPKRQLESDSNTKLLLHFNRNDTTFIDSSPSAHTITAYGDAKQLCSPCGSGVAYFDGNGDYLTVPDSIDWVPTADNWAIEFNYNFISKTNTHGFCGQYIDIGNFWGMAWDATNKRFVLQGMTSSLYNLLYVSANNTFDPILNTNYHIAYVKSGSIVTVYVNGSAISMTATQPLSGTNNISAVFTIGLYYSNLYSHCYMSEFRFSNIARYTSNFTPSTTPFLPDPYTKLLLHMDGTGNAFYDSSDPPGDNGFLILPDGVTITPSGTFAVQKMKDGRNIWKFDGSTNYIAISNHDAFNFGSKNFTICNWIKVSSLSASSVMYGGGDASITAASRSIQTIVSNTGNVIVYLWDTVSAQTKMDTLYACSINTWYHIAVVRSGNVITVYVNGQSVYSAAYTATLQTPTTIFGIGSAGVYTDARANGNIKDLQIFKGKALTQDQIAAIYKETYIY